MTRFGDVGNGGWPWQGAGEGGWGRDAPGVGWGRGASRRGWDCKGRACDSVSSDRARVRRQRWGSRVQGVAGPARPSRCDFLSRGSPRAQTQSPQLRAPPGSGPGEEPEPPDSTGQGDHRLRGARLRLWPRPSVEHGPPAEAPRDRWRRRKPVGPGRGLAAARSFAAWASGCANGAAGGPRGAPSETERGGRASGSEGIRRLDRGREVS